MDLGHGYVLELAKRRKTIREFSSEKIDLEDVIYAINVAKEAPSGANRQPWRFVIVIDNEKKKVIREICERIEKRFYSKAPDWFKTWASSLGITWEKPFLTQAPVLLFVFADIKAPSAVQSVWLAIGYILLALEERGLVTVTYTPSELRWANELLKVPNNYRLQAILPIGKMKMGYNYEKQPRFRISDILFLEEFGRKMDLYNDRS